MNIFMLEHMQSFSCIGSACPISCCAGWTVSVDKESAAYYRSVEGSFGKYLKDNLVETETGTLMKICEGRCAFLDEQNLCRIYRELGKDKLCHTCTYYPRIMSRQGDLMLLTMTMACPEVVRLLFASPKPIEILYMEDEEEPAEGPDFDWNYFAMLSKALLTGIGLLQDRSLTIAHRQRLFLLMCKSVDDALDAGNWREANEYMDLFGAPEAYSVLYAEETPVNLTEKIRTLADVSLLFGIQSMKDKDSRISRLFHDSVSWLRSSDDNLAAALGRLELLNQEPYAAEQEHLMVSLLFRHFLDAMVYRSFFRAGTFAVLLNQFQRLFTACWPDGDREALPPQSARIETICYLSRFLEHTSYFPKLLHDLLNAQNYYDLEKLYNIVS